jgi:hypothetical protein
MIPVLYCLFAIAITFTFTNGLPNDDIHPALKFMESSTLSHQLDSVQRVNPVQQFNSAQQLQQLQQLQQAKILQQPQISSVQQSQPQQLQAQQLQSQQLQSQSQQLQSQQLQAQQVQLKNSQVSQSVNNNVQNDYFENTMITWTVSQKEMLLKAGLQIFAISKVIPYFVEVKYKDGSIQIGMPNEILYSDALLQLIVSEGVYFGCPAIANKLNFGMGSSLAVRIVCTMLLETFVAPKNIMSLWNPNFESIEFAEKISDQMKLIFEGDIVVSLYETRSILDQIKDSSEVTLWHISQSQLARYYSKRDNFEHVRFILFTMKDATKFTIKTIYSHKFNSMPEHSLPQNNGKKISMYGLSDRFYGMDGSTFLINL